MTRATKLLLCLLFVITSCPFVAAGQNSSGHPPDEFEEFSADTVVTNLSSSSSPVSTSYLQADSPKEGGGLFWVSGILFFTVLAGLSVRFRYTRQLRSLFLVLSIIILGFYAGGCPCSIQSLQNSILLFAGQSVKWHSIIYIAGLIFIAYLFGRVFCGWICQLGALQELIFRTSGFSILQDEHSQKMMRMIRTVVLLLLILQLLITRTNLYKEIDPFRVIFNFYSTWSIGWWLAGLLVLSSVIIYRPFCKTVCPVGLILGWVSKIPGASVLGIKENCISCKRCNDQCDIRAITRDTKEVVLDNQECIRCGNCLNGCMKEAVQLCRNNKRYPSRNRAKQE